MLVEPHSQMRSRNPECDWVEDFSHENGNYCCVCLDCGKEFVGHKRRIVCKVCASAFQKKVEES